MKLKNKILLPLFTVGAAATVVMPLAVSCGQNQKISLDPVIPTIARAIPDPNHPDPYNAEEATRLYAQHVHANSEVYEQDARFYYSSFGLMALSYAFENDGFKPEDIQFSYKFTIKDIKAEFDEFSKYMFLNYDMNFDLFVDSGVYAMDIVPTTLGAAHSSSGVNKIELNGLNIQLKNVPCHLYSITSSKWDLYPDYTEFGEATAITYPWSIKIQMKSGSILSRVNFEYAFVYNNESFAFDNLNLPSQMTFTNGQWRLLQLICGALIEIPYIYHMGDIAGSN